MAVGGIIGVPNCYYTIKNSHNSGAINAIGQRVGGIVASGNEADEIIGCTNSGNISAGGEFVGGIIGTLLSNSLVESCKNSGNVTGNNKVGGIVGSANSSNQILYCSNTGEVTGTTDYIGGIVGRCSQANKLSNITVIKCYNSGSVTSDSKQYVGGIIGFLFGDNGGGTIKQCYNKGVITGTSNIGEIIGNKANKTGLDELQHLYYLINTRNLTAIGNEEDNESKKIMGVSNDFMTYEDFKTWVEQQ